MLLLARIRYTKYCCTDFFTGISRSSKESSTPSCHSLPLPQAVRAKTTPAIALLRVITSLSSRIGNRMGALRVKTGVYQLSVNARNQHKKLVMLQTALGLVAQIGEVVLLRSEVA